MEPVVRRRPKPRSILTISHDVISWDVEINRRRSSLFSERMWIGVVVFYLVIFGIVLYCDLQRFPVPKGPITSEENRSFKFSELSARYVVEDLSLLGPKVTGSNINEKIVVEYFSKKLRDIQRLTKKFNKLEFEVQTSSGCFPLDFKDGMISCYSNVKNVVARLGPLKSTNKSLLINCHYDSVPTSPGSSDDLVSCGIMLEVLLALVHHDKPLQHSVVFLFNGAEENMLQAAHGFITKHRWAKEVVGFINLEACGSGGKQMLFQSDQKRTWLLQAYAASSSYPQGSVLAQDIFQSGLIPADTDYHIFKDFGGLPGLDFAFVKNGYVYHTKYDTPKFITPGAVQQAGDNLLGLIHEALMSPAMRQQNLEEYSLDLGYFDFLGFFMVVYRVKMATLLNVVMILISFADMYFRIIYYREHRFTPKYKMMVFGKATFILFFSAVLAVAVNIIIAVFLDILGVTMSWYRNPVIIIGLYVCPSLTVIMMWNDYFIKKIDVDPLGSWVAEEGHFHAARLFWILLLVIMELLRLKSSFICTAWVTFPTIVRCLSYIYTRYVQKRGSKFAVVQVVIHLFMQIFPLLLLVYCMWSMYTVFIPIVGRVGAIVNPDVIIGAFTAVIIFLVTSYTMSLMQVTYSVHRIIRVLAVIFLVTLVLIIFTPVGFPYSQNQDSPSLQRYYILHTQRNFYNQSKLAHLEDSGYWVVPLDYNGPTTLFPYINGLKDLSPVDCEGELLCGMPFYMPLVSILKRSFYVAASKPDILHKPKINLLSVTSVHKTFRNMTFRVTGPDHMTIVVSPKQNVDVLNWTLTDGTPFPSLSWQGRPTYFIYYSYGEYTKPWEFSLLVNVPVNYSRSSLIDLVFISHVLHGPNAVTGDFPYLLQQIPQWIHVTPWTCTFHLYTY